jgi:hypothetical protein
MLLLSAASPQLPKLLELVGLGYTSWFVYRYLLFKVRESRGFRVENQSYAESPVLWLVRKSLGPELNANMLIICLRIDTGALYVSGQLSQVSKP